jgi:hypothetical protein
VHKKIQRFISLDLIEKTKTIDHAHSAIYYRLSDVGVFHILTNLYSKYSLFEDEGREIIIGLIDHFGDNDFFHVFVYPFFSKSTISKITSSTILLDFLSYCYQCCRRVLLSSFFTVYALMPELVLVKWSDFTNFSVSQDSRRKVGSWLSGLKSRYQQILNTELHGCLDWLNSEIKLELVDENNFVIKKNGNEMALKLLKSDKRALLIFDKKKLIEYNIESDDHDYLINLEDIKKRVAGVIHSLVSELKIFRDYVDK